jgi:hypothetical protein
MFGLVLAGVLCGQGPEFVKGYTPQVGDTVVLARDEPGRRVPIVKNAGAAMSFFTIIDGGSEDHYEAVVDGDQLAEIEAGTPAQLMDVTNTRTPIFMVEILGGPHRGLTTFTYAPFCRQLDPAAAKKAAAERRKRGPLDKKAVAEDVKVALAQAKLNEAPVDLTGKKRLVREAVEPICKKYKADFIELNNIATQAGIVVALHGEKYDVAGNRLRKLGVGADAGPGGAKPKAKGTRRKPKGKADRDR